MAKNKIDYKALKIQKEKERQIAEFLKEGNIEKLNEPDFDFDVNEMIYYSRENEYKNYPLEVAKESSESIKWLMEKGVDINNKYSPILHTAFRENKNELIEILIESGADIHMLDHVGKDVLEVLLIGRNFKKYDNKELIEKLEYVDSLGHTIKEYGGKAFRGLVFEIIARNYSLEEYKEVLDFFIEKDVDVNYDEKDKVFTQSRSSIYLAASYGNLEMCKYLVENKADILLKTSDGGRAYNGALERYTSYATKESANHEGVIEYLKSLEPKELHDKELRAKALEEYNVPKKLIEIFCSKERKYKIIKEDESFRVPTTYYDGDEEVHDTMSFFEYYKGLNSFEFHFVTDVMDFDFKDEKHLIITKPDEKYGQEFYYNVDSKKVSVYDSEHESYGELATFEKFLEVISKEEN